jgi:hypothetical protein
VARGRWRFAPLMGQGSRSWGGSYLQLLEEGDKLTNSLLEGAKQGVKQQVLINWLVVCEKQIIFDGAR